MNANSHGPEEPLPEQRLQLHKISFPGPRLARVKHEMLSRAGDVRRLEITVVSHAFHEAAHGYGSSSYGALRSGQPDREAEETIVCDDRL